MTGTFDKYPLSGFLKCNHRHRALQVIALLAQTTSTTSITHPHTYKQKEEGKELCTAGLKYLKAREIDSQMPVVIYKHVEDKALFCEAIKKAFLNKRKDSFIKKTEVKSQVKHVRVTFLDYLDSEGGLNDMPYEDKIL